ncbi:MAG: DNA primase DnaG [archaeon]
MGKTYINTVKYNIKAKFEIQGLVDKHDIIGAVFGQSEGLIGEDLDLRELQKNGKIGRIDIFPSPENGKTVGSLIVPSSLDMVQTSILAAAVESIEKVGPYESKFAVEQIEDTRTNKREEIKKRAKELLGKFLQESTGSGEMSEEVRESARISEIKAWGPERLPAGPDIEKEEEIILVEGRADVLNLLRNGVKNVVGMNGSKIPESIPELCKRKTVTMFSDGDRGGELIQRQLMDSAKIDFLARAPDGKEVEELQKKEITMALRKRIPAKDIARKQTFLKPRSFPPKFSSSFRPRTEMRSNNFSPTPRPLNRGFERPREFDSPRTFDSQRPRPFDSRSIRPFSPRNRFSDENPIRPILSLPATEEEKTKFNPIMDSVKGKMEAVLMDEKGREIKRTKIRELIPELKTQKQVESIVLDGIITKRLLDEAKNHSVKYVVGVKKGKLEETPEIKTLVM